MKESYIFLLILFFAAAAFFLYSASKETKTVAPLNVTAPGQLKTLSKTSGAKINPPHGKPGHRCDLPAGAQLPDPGTSSAPIPALNPIISNAIINKVPVRANEAPQASQATPKAPAASSVLKINPAHGEPGHRCDIKTGDPLPLSGSGTAAARTTPPVKVSPAPAITAKVNPPHGQEGHRCDIQVGALLPAG